MRKQFQVQGMHCDACAASIKRTLELVPGVAHAEVTLADHCASVDFDEKQTNAATLKTRIEDLGYEVR